MRLFPQWVKTTLREDKEFYRALLDAAEAGPNADQTKTLASVKHHHLDHNRDLTRELYEEFVEVLQELKVLLPDVRLNSRNAETGSWYVIPAKGRLQEGKNQSQRLAQRAIKRKKLWASVVETTEYNLGEIELLLSHEESQLKQMLQTILSEVQSTEKRLQKQINELTRTITQSD